MKIIVWDDFDKFSHTLDLYLPDMGEGETRATQAVTAVNNLVYRWFNDGDTYDSSFNESNGELCTMANWLSNYCDGCNIILDKISSINSKNQYSMVLYKVATLVLGDYSLLKFMNKFDKIDSIYTCKGSYKSY